MLAGVAGIDVTIRGLQPVPMELGTPGKAKIPIVLASEFVLVAQSHREPPDRSATTRRAYHWDVPRWDQEQCHTRRGQAGGLSLRTYSLGRCRIRSLQTYAGPANGLAEALRSSCADRFLPIVTVLSTGPVTVNDMMPWPNGCARLQVSTLGKDHVEQASGHDGKRGRWPVYS